MLILVVKKVLSESTPFRLAAQVKYRFLNYKSVVREKYHFPKLRLKAYPHIKIVSRE